MNNWSPEHTKEIKAWLNIDNYRKFEDLSLIHFYHELWARNLFFKEYREEFESRTLMEGANKSPNAKKRLCK
ncbi:DUF6387 family protein [Enterobacter kobei]|uniref:DUF6387 family protein n=1 Tax=Enterobacter kobei TaxID=208224 RepID=UPI002876D8A1|nr:DUF6387 family protein [Enterobacter kobei]MDS0026947.1 DUF6387 family protein [Enterobacter kobei]